MDYVVREIRLDDPAEPQRLADMWNASDAGWPGGWTRGVQQTAAMWAENLERHDCETIFVADSGGELVGFASMEIAKTRPEAAHLPLLNVRPDWHGQGCGKALILNVLQRSIDRGCRQLNLGTWAGNLKAVPLYKKTGFFWQPETNVWMRNFIPTLLAMPLGRRFFNRHDWYPSFARPIEIRPDEFLWHGVKVFPYRFEVDGEMFAVWIDPQAEAPTAVETEELAIACWLGEEEVVCGVPRTVTWELINKSVRPLPVSLMANGDPGIALDLVESFTVTDRVVLEREFTVSPDIPRRRQGELPPMIHSSLLVDGTPVVLASGFRPVQAVELSARDSETLMPGKDGRLTVSLRNRLPVPVRGEVVLEPRPGATVAPATIPFEVDARSWAGGATTVRVDAEGVVLTSARVVIPGAGQPELGIGEQVLRTRPQPLALRGLPLGGAYAWLDEESEWLTVEAPLLRLGIQLRGGQVQLHDRLRETQLLNLRTPSIGPPFTWWQERPPRYEHTVETRGGEVTVSLLIPSTARPCLVLERRLTLGAGPFLRVEHRVINTGDTPQTAQLQCPQWGQLSGPYALPLHDGLLYEQPEGDWPAHEGDVPKEASAYAERWQAREGDGMVVGLIWQEAVEANVFSLIQAVPEVPAHGTVALPAFHLVAGAGDWRLVRRLWRWLQQPAGVREDLPPARGAVVTAGFAPQPVLLTGTEAKATLALRARRAEPLSGRWSLAAPGLRFAPSEGELPPLDREHPVDATVTVSADDATPRAVAVPVAIDGPEPRTHATSVVVLGDGSDPTVSADGEQWVIDNGLLRLAVAPGHHGSAVSLRWQGVERLRSSWPEPRPFKWYNPWFGGLGPVVGWSAWPVFAAETFTGGPVERVGERGLCWRGVQVVCEPQHKDLRWLRLEAEYLTVGGSNLLALVVRAINRTGARQGHRFGWTAFVDPGEAATLHWEVDRPAADPQAGPWARERAAHSRAAGEHGYHQGAERWLGLELGDGQTLGLVVPPRVGAHGEHDGTKDVELDWGRELELDSGESREVLTWLACSPSPAASRAYQVLREITALP